MQGENVVQCLLALLYQLGCFSSLKGFQSHLTFRANINLFSWSNLHFNFMSTGQDSTYIGLEDCIVFSEGNTVSSAWRLPIDPSLGFPPCPRPICIPDEPFNYGRSPRSSGPLFFSQNCNPILGLKIKCSPHNFNPHIKHGIQPLKLYQYSVVPSIVVKVGPTSQFPELMCSWSCLTLNH
jgi:hypothetical protein